MEHRPALTNLQRELLTLFALEMSEEDLHAIKRLLARYFAEKATEAMDRFVDASDLTAEDLKRWAYDHERAATDRP